jgi:hypothetical protein
LDSSHTNTAGPVFGSDFTDDAGLIPDEMKRSDVHKVIIIVLALTVLLLGGGYAFGAFEGIGWHGIGALVVGVTFSLALGVGLMVLMYASSRSHDEDAHLAAKNTFRDDSESAPVSKPDKKSR